MIPENHIKKLRKRAGLTQDELAYEIGVTRKTIGRVENRQWRVSRKMGIKLTEYFKCNVSDLYPGLVPDYMWWNGE